MLKITEILKEDFNKYIGLTVSINIIFIIFLYYSGYFNIGLLSDSYEDITNALNHSFADFFSDTIYTGRFRPLLFLLLKLIIEIYFLTGVSFDNFIVFQFVNVVLYILFGITAGYLVFKVKRNYAKAVLANLVLIVFPNNIMNLCWSASFFEIFGMILFLIHLLLFRSINNKQSLPLSILSVFILVTGLLLKEIFIILPFVSIIFVFIISGKIKKYIKLTFAIEILLLFIYYIFRLLFITGIRFTSYNINDMINLTIKIGASFLIPGDYIVSYKNILSLDIYLLSYIISVFLLFLLLIYNSRNNAKKYLLLIMATIISVSPYFYAGYIRPQLIFIPFSIFVVLIFIIFEDHNMFKYETLLITIITIQFFFGSHKVIIGWENAYNNSVKRVKQLIEFNSDFKNTIIIGNVNRVEQYYIFDKILYIYNYWKYKEYTVKDSLDNFLSISTLNPNIDNAQINYFKIGNDYLLAANDENTFFNVTEFGETLNNKFIIKNTGEVTVTKRNSFNKITELLFKPFDSRKNILIFDGSGIKLINQKRNI